MHTKLSSYMWVDSKRHQTEDVNHKKLFTAGIVIGGYHLVSEALLQQSSQIVTLAGIWQGGGTPRRHCVYLVSGLCFFFFVKSHIPNWLGLSFVFLAGLGGSDVFCSTITDDFISAFAVVRSELKIGLKCPWQALGCLIFLRFDVEFFIMLESFSKMAMGSWLSDCFHPFHLQKGQPGSQ